MASNTVPWRPPDPAEVDSVLTRTPVESTVIPRTDVPVMICAPRSISWSPRAEMSEPVPPRSPRKTPDIAGGGAESRIVRRARVRLPPRAAAAAS